MIRIYHGINENRWGYFVQTKILEILNLNFLNEISTRIDKKYADTSSSTEK